MPVSGHWSSDGLLYDLMLAANPGKRANVTVNVRQTPMQWYFNSINNSFHDEVKVVR